MFHASSPSFPPQIITGKGKRGPDEGKEEIENLRDEASP